MPTLKAVCRETALSERWVRREAKDRSKGRGHSDDAECPTDPCLWCDALRWVLANADEVRRTHGAADRKARLQRAHERTVASVTWKRDNADLWDFLDGMVTGGFKNAAVEAVEAGIVSEAMEDALRAAVKRKPVPPPPVGAWVDIVGLMETVTESVDRRGRTVLRVEFIADDGWRGRVEVTDPPVIRAWRGAKAGTSFSVRGRVVWRVERLAVVDAVGTLSPVER